MYRVWPEVTQLAHIRVAAIIFSDGTHTGHAKDILCGKDVIECIFDTRRGLADGYAELAKERSGESFTQMTSHLTAPATRRTIPLSKALASQTEYDRAKRSAGEIHEMVLRQKEADVQAGKLTPATAQGEISDSLQKPAQFWEERATDNGDLQ